MIVLNQIKVAEDKDCEDVWVHGIQYHVCHVCGRMVPRRQTRNGKVYCPKHYKQEWRHGKIIDHNPRTGNDLNEIRVLEDHAEMDIYDKHGNVIATTLISLESIEDVRNTKWCLGTRNYVITNKDPWGNKNKLHHIVTGSAPDQPVDHINHDPLDNRIENLRLVTKSENAHNLTKTPEGVDWHEPTKKWRAAIREQNNQIHLGLYEIKAEAEYARHYAEQTLHKKFAYARKMAIIPEDRAREIEEKVRTQLRKYIDIDGTGEIPPLAWDNPDRPRPIRRRDVRTPEGKSRN